MGVGGLVQDDPGGCRQGALGTETFCKNEKGFMNIKKNKNKNINRCYCCRRLFLELNSAGGSVSFSLTATIPW